ncbi:hypothetical protein [Caenimonas sedimenti]|uniref:hypothetical protein n=1 Tax=Caenimonas sedimenti TaxID=2596921 RepID=UPI002108190E|nr:hypothetical protein [Caenimonas sedimenti]
MFEKVGTIPKYSLNATLKRWNGAANATLVKTPSMAPLSMPASVRAALAASQANAMVLRPGTRPTADRPAPTIAVRPRMLRDEGRDEEEGHASSIEVPFADQGRVRRIAGMHLF